MVERIVTRIGKISYSLRWLIALLAIALFACVAQLQAQAIIEYSYAEESIVTDVFPQDDTVLIVYDNIDEDKMDGIIEYLSADEHVTSVQAYANTLGAPMTPKELSELMGIDVSLVNTLFYIKSNGMEPGVMTLVEFVTFISSDAFMNNEMFSSMIDEETKAQIYQLTDIITAIASEREYTAEEISAMLGVEKRLVTVVFYAAGMMDMSTDKAPATVIATLAQMLGMNSLDIEEKLGVKPVTALRIADFVDVITTLTGYAEGLIDEEQLAGLGMLADIAHIVREGRMLTPAELAEVFSGYAENEAFNESNLSLLYLLAKSNAEGATHESVALYDLFIFICEDIIGSETFAPFFDESVASQIEEAKVTMEDGKAQLVGEKHARLIFTIDYVPDSKGMQDFYLNLTERLDSVMMREYYLVGASAMSYEVSESFSREYVIISIVTAVAVFAVVFITFKKLSVSLLLIFIIETAVFSMMSVMTLTGSPMYFIALILVQCILMGSMIDYGILFTTYYIEVRREYSVRNALPEVMRRATHAILLSSTILILVTTVCGLFMSGAVASILKTLGVGALCAILLVMFVLPSLLAIFDRVFIEDGAPK